jgi:hypothetical protein
MTRTSATVAHELSTDSLVQLSQRGVGAIHVEGFYPREVASGVVQKVIDHQSLGPHNDRIDQETDASEIAGLTEQLVANVYLQVPDEGGDLQLWLRDPTDQEKQTILEVEGLEPDSIEPPALTFHPSAGDLIIFSSAMLHAVTSAAGQHRVGMASFIGCKATEEPLFYWS